MADPPNDQTVKSKDEAYIKLVNRIFSNEPFKEKIMMPTVMGRPVMKSEEEKFLDSVTESCIFKSLLSGVMGNLEFILIGSSFIIQLFNNKYKQIEHKSYHLMVKFS